MASAPMVALSMGQGIWQGNGVGVQYIPSAYLQALSQANMIPLLVPPGVPKVVLRALYQQADGVVLSGGGDVNPIHSGLTPDHPAAHYATNIDDARDTTEIHLARWAYADDKPLLGICRGHQVINVALGGSLIMDIPSLVENAITHQVDGTPRWRRELLHTIQINPDSDLAHILASDEILVNSIHHQAIDRLGDGLTPIAYAEDGIIEAVAARHKQFFMGVQWHPEEITTVSPPMQSLFLALAQALP